MSTMITNLPRDLVEEILSRVPLKSMRSVRLTSKNWNALSKSRNFTKMHIGKEEEAARELGESRMIMLMDYNLHLMNIVVNENPSKKPLGKLTFLNEQVKISQVFHCEGLLLCILEDDITKVVVWNPYLVQTRWIKTRNNYRCGLYKYAIGYENKKNKSCRSHKILNFHIMSKIYEIYDFDSELWTALDVTRNWYIEFYDHGVSLKGNTYWCAREKNSPGVIDYIICFDFTRERFGPLMTIPFRGVGNNNRVTLSCVREEKLAALYDERYKSEIWITTKIEAGKISWSKFLTRQYPILSGSFFIDEEKKTTMGFEDNCEFMNHHNTLNIIGEAGHFSELNIGESINKNFRNRHVWSYVPSLVQIIKQPARSKRKHPKQLRKASRKMFRLEIFSRNSPKAFRR